MRWLSAAIGSVEARAEYSMAGCSSGATNGPVRSAHASAAIKKTLGNRGIRDTILLVLQGGGGPDPRAGLVAINRFVVARGWDVKEFQELARTHRFTLRLRGF